MNTVFLDIDGVLQPYNSEYRFYSTNEKLIEELSNKYNTDYSIYSWFDVAAVYYDWDEQAIARLRYILDTTNSNIIMSSNWKSDRYPNKMKDLLKIHDLDKYYFADNKTIFETCSLPKLRYLEINDSLKNYDIKNFVVLDDMKGLYDYFPDNSVITNNIISISDMNKCIKILKRLR